MAGRRQTQQEKSRRMFAKVLNTFEGVAQITVIFIFWILLNELLCFFSNQEGSLLSFWENNRKRGRISKVGRVSRAVYPSWSTVPPAAGTRHCFSDTSPVRNP